MGGVGLGVQPIINLSWGGLWQLNIHFILQSKDSAGWRDIVNQIMYEILWIYLFEQTLNLYILLTSNISSLFTFQEIWYFMFYFSNTLHKTF